MDTVFQIVRQIGAIFKKMSPVQRTNFFLLSAIMLICLVALLVWAGRQEYTLLYANLTPRSAASIKQKLDEQKIPHRLDGNAIYVASDAVYEIRLQLAAEGLPQGDGIGYEIFDKTSFAMTDYMQNLNYKRALEGELVRTISSLRGIQGARVHLTIPKRELFVADSNAPTASVVLNISPAMQLSKEQIGGIVYLVASSVQGLKPEQVTVVDSRGYLLSGFGDQASHTGLSAKQLDAQQSAEAYLERKAESMLVAMLGPGKAIVRVTAHMNFDQMEKTAETFDPDSAVARSETRSEETVKDEQEKPAAEAASGRSSEKAQEKTVTNYEINRTVERIVSAAGTIKRLSVSVVVDGTYTVTETGEGKEKTVSREYAPRSEEEREKFKQLVMHAVGFDSRRGDEIVVSDASFDTSLFEQEQNVFSAVENRSVLLRIVQHVVVGIVFVLAFLFLMTMIKKYSAAAPAGVGGDYGTGVNSQTAGRGAEYTQASNTEAQLRELAQKNPNRIAELLSEWLREG